MSKLAAVLRLHLLASVAWEGKRKKNIKKVLYYACLFYALCHYTIILTLLLVSLFAFNISVA